MAWIADLHIHSHYSRATSRESAPASLMRWAGLKGLSLIGSGDFTHSGWRDEIREACIPDEGGFYRLKSPFKPEIPGQTEPRFIISGELSTIYKQGDRVRKVHHLILLPSLEDAERISLRLEALGMNLRSDGRPILGMDSRRLFALVLEASPEAILIPAHIWTPHFSVFGSNSGFDTIEECYGDLTAEISALETGLSSDPAMNWRWSALDRFTLVSNSDAHNPRNLGREANIIEADFSYAGLKQALKDGIKGGFKGTIEFFPEEGKYHYDGHRNCGICWGPEETLKNNGACTLCGRPVTVGVLHRVMALADRAAPLQPEKAPAFESLVPLREVIGSAIGSGPTSQKTETIYFNLLHSNGPELVILRETDLASIEAAAGVFVAEGIRRLRRREVTAKPGYDGEYGSVSVLDEATRRQLSGQTVLFKTEKPGSLSENRKSRKVLTMAKTPSIAPESLIANQPLSQEQQRIVAHEAPVLAVIAGPGTGKTRTLVERIAHFIAVREIVPESITAVTFTNKAARELRERLQTLLKKPIAERMHIGTFHGLAWQIVRRDPINPPPRLLDEIEVLAVVAETLHQTRITMNPRAAALLIATQKNSVPTPAGMEPLTEGAVLLHEYQRRLAEYHRWDFDDIINEAIRIWTEDPEWLQPFRNQFQHLFIDEFQDLNLAQYNLTKLWSAKGASVTVIGDPNQSIYGFRGASAACFDQLRKERPETILFKLSHNYRSAVPIIRAANALVDPSFHQEITAETASEPLKIQWLEAASAPDAAQAIAAEISKLMGGATMNQAHGRKHERSDSRESYYSLGEMAVLYRIGRQADLLERAFSGAGLPYRVTGQSPALEDPEVKEFLAFFRWLLAPEDQLLLRTALGGRRWGMTRAELKAFYLFSQESAILQLDPSQAAKGLPENIAQKFNLFYDTAVFFRGKIELPPLRLVAEWRKGLEGSESEAMGQLAAISQEYGSIRSFIQLLPLALEADLSRRSKPESPQTELITCSTIHAAKGLEFPIVFLFGTEEGYLPYGKDPSPEQVSEEQRLFYVALTRCRERLFILNNLQRMTSEGLVSSRPSRFLQLLPAELLEKRTVIHRRKPSQLELFKFNDAD